MTRQFTAFALTLLSLSLFAQENNPLIVSGQLLQEAGNLLDSGQYKKAIKLYERIDRNDTNYVRALYGISECLYEDSQFSASLEYARQGLRLNSDPERGPDLYNRVANTLNEANASEEAIKVYDSAINKYPAYSVFYLNKGSALIRLGRYAEAEAVFKQALLIDPYSYGSHYKLGYCALLQGKLVPAFLSYMGYLLLDPEGRFKANCIRGLDAIARNMDTIQTILSKRTIDPDGNYSLLEQILQSKIALDKNYKPITQLDDPICRQIQVVFEKMEYQQADSDFWMQYYIPYFKSAFVNRQFEYLINRMFEGVDIPAIQEFNKKNKKEIKVVLDGVAAYFNHIRSTRELNYVKRDTAAASWFYSDGELASHGKYLAKEDKLLGDWQFFYHPGNIRSTGSYNNNGKKEGWFDSYYFDGKPKTKEFYSDGLQEGEETSWFSTGTMASHSWYKKGMLEGESVSYFWVGTPHTITHYHDGKEDGVKLTFQNNGDTSLLEHYVAGTLNGEVKSWNGNRGIDVIAAYRDGQLDGDYKRYYPNGRLQIEGNYKAGKQDGEWKAWYNNGQLKSVDHFVNDKSEGEYREYYDNGVLRYSCNQKNGKITGEVRYFDDDGKLYSIDNYSGGRLQK
ncbi:MAG TPA: tetratricopeptide repeat protein, partial [Puia sp.]|nr:tetratricopeptide repeat protein [Puia sp.]